MRPNLVTTNSDDVILMKEWLNKQCSLGISPEYRLTPIQCQELHRLGYDPEDLVNGREVGGNEGHVVVYDWVNGAWVEGFAEIEKLHKLFAWRQLVDAADVADSAQSGKFARDKLSLTSSNFSFSFSGDEEIIDKWLNRHREVKIPLAKRLTGSQVQELHRLGWNPKDLTNNEGDWRAVDPMSGNDLIGIDNILASGKIVDFRTAFNAVDPAIGLVSPRDNEIIDAWLEKISQEGIDPNKLTVTHIQNLHQQGWNPNDIQWWWGNFGTRDFTVINPATGVLVNPGGFAGVNQLGKKKTWWKSAWRTAMGGAAAGPRNRSLDGSGANNFDNLAMDKWFELTKIGGGKIANNKLTAANARALWNNNWESKDILGNSYNSNDYAAKDPVTGNFVAGFDNIMALGDKKVLENTAKNNAKNNYRANFRAAANATTSQKAHDELKDDNEANNFIIDQYCEQRIAVVEAVAAYNNGWVYGSEIGYINNGQQIAVTLDGGSSGVACDWKTITRADFRQDLADELARNKMDAYQVDDAGARWNPPLSDFEKGKIAAITNASGVREVQKEIQLTRFRVAVRQAATGQAATDFGTLFAPILGSDFIIDQFAGIPAAEVVAAYNQGWIYGLEIQIEGGQKKYRFADGGWINLDWTVNDRNTPFNTLTPELQAKTKALQLDDTGNRWDPPLDKEEIKEIEAAADVAAVATVLTRIKKRRLFVNGFRAKKSMLRISVPLTDILAYWNLQVNLTVSQATALYNGNPQVLGSELTKKTDNEVVFNGKVFDLTVSDVVDQLRVAKQTKIAADATNAATAKLAQAQINAEIAIKAEQKTAGKTEITDEELNKHLKDVDKVLADTIKTWQGYIKAATTESEVASRQTKVMAAITALRTTKETPPFDVAIARITAIAAVKAHWKTKSSDQTENGTVNGKTITELLGTDWEKEFNDKDQQVNIDSKQKELTDKINAEQAKEPKKEKKLTDEQVEKAIQAVLGDNTIKPAVEVVKSWQAYNNADSKLKTLTEIQDFLKENIKDKETDFAQFLEELPADDKPTGNADKEKVNNFLTNKKAETVIKTVFSYKLKDETYQAQIATEMENEKDDEKPLNEEIYPKQDGKYTKEAMVKYLYEKETGQSHQFSIKEEREDNLQTPTGGKSHWDEWKYWYVGGGILILVVVGLVAIFWENLMGSAEKEK